MKLLAYLLLTAAVIIVTGIGITHMESQLSISAAGFIGVAVSPYIGLTLCLKRARRKSSIATGTIVGAIVAGFGIWTFIDAMLVNPEAQSGLVFIVVPLWQWALILSSGLLYFLLNLRKNVCRRVK